MTDGTDWTRHARRVGASAWYYHAGLVVFAWMTTRPWLSRTQRLSLALLLVRDVAIARLWRRGNVRGLAAGAHVTDLLALRPLAAAIPVREFRTCRPISQLGLPAAWGLTVAEPRLPVAAAWLLPAAHQVACVRTWSLGTRPAAVYLLRAGLSSAASLWGVEALRRLLDAATDAEMELATVSHQVLLARARVVKEAAFHQWLHDGWPFTETQWRARTKAIAAAAQGGYLLVAEAFRAERERVKSLDRAAMTLQVLVVRVRSRRARDDVMLERPDGPVFLTEPRQRLDELIEVLARAQGPLHLAVEESPSSVAMTARATRFPAVVPGWLQRIDGATLMVTLHRWVPR